MISLRGVGKRYTKYEDAPMLLTAALRSRTRRSDLWALREVDAGPVGRGSLLPALRALLDHPASKTDAAASLHLSRAAFYDRLAKIERVLGTGLDDPEVRLSLHLALLADDLSRSRS